MAVADRIYESACECRDLEESLNRVLRENTEQRELYSALTRCANELVEEIKDASVVVTVPAGIMKRAEVLKNFLI